MTDVDILVEQDPLTGIFEIGIGDDGDFAKTEGFDTSIAMSLFTDKRASGSEVPASDLRRGWWGVLFNGVFPLFEEGSKIWLLEQARKTQDTLNDAIDFANESLQWLITDDHAKSIDVQGEFTDNGILLTITIFRDQSVVESKSFEFWQNTGSA